MKRPVFGIALALLIALVSGCANSARPFAAKARSSAPRAFALAVTVQGGLQPTPLQWAAVQAKFADEFSWRGWILVTDLALADYIVRVDFTPDPADPENKGQAVVVGIRDNPRALLGTLTTLSPYPTSFGYAGTFQSALWSPGFSNAYYGWSDSFYDGYSYSSPTLNPAKPSVVTTTSHPPYRHHRPDDPGQAAYCPPVDATHPHRHYLPGDFAPRPPVQPAFADASDLATNPRRWSSNGSRSWSRGAPTYSDSSTGSDRTHSRSSWRSRSEPSYASSDSTSSSRPDRLYSRSDSSSWHSDRSSYSDSGYSRSDSGYSGSGSSYSRSDSGYSRSDSGHWHSRSDSGGSSSSSYSQSSSSSSSSPAPTPDSSSSSSSGSSSSGSSGDSGSGDRTTQPN